MLNRRFVDIYGYAAIAAMLIMLALVAARIVPVKFYTPLFYVAAMLFALRIILRVALARQQGKKTEEEEEDKEEEP